MLKLFALCISLVSTLEIAVGQTSYQPFTYKTVAQGLTIPWEIEEGPDGWLWVTERIGVLSRIHIETGEKQVLLDKRGEVFSQNECGMLGFAIHPNFADTPWVFVATVLGNEAHLYRIVERYTYKNGVLEDPVEVFRYEPAFIIHQGCRLHIDSDRMLWITNGDSPESHRSVLDESTVGKILRVHLDGSAPLDNPVPGNPYWSKGHRNVQGFAKLPNGTIWASEHGPAIEDEVNLILKGRNYGWPYVEGRCDEDYELAYCDSANVVEPAWSTGSVTHAPCGLVYYNHDRFPMLKNSLLQSLLKSSAILQLQLSEDGTGIENTRWFLNYSTGRIRDFAVTRDGRIFFCTSNREPNARFPFPMESDDRILELQLTPENAEPELIIPDTVHVSALPGYPREFSIPISNIGNGSAELHFAWNLEGQTELRSAQWQLPIVIVPGQTYSTWALFEPTEMGEYTQRVFFGFSNDVRYTVHLVGNTNIGVLEPASDTTEVNVSSVQGDTVRIPFVNVGTDTIEVTDASITSDSTDDGVHIINVETGPLAPGDTAWITIEVQPSTDSTVTISVVVFSDGYHLPKATVIIHRSITSVSEDNLVNEIRCIPNPFGTTVLFDIPEHSNGILTISDLLGNIVWTSQTVGGRVRWDGRTSQGTSVVPGMYVVRFVSNNMVLTSLLMRESP